MTAGSGGRPFGVNDFLGGVASSTGAGAPRAEKGVQMRGREIDGQFYVRAEDVVALLRTNRVLPKAVAALLTRCPR